MNRRNSVLTATIAATLLAIAAIAVPRGSAEEGTAKAALTVAPGSELSMQGKSTMHEWEAGTRSVNVVFTRLASQADPAGAAAIEALVRANGVRGVDVQIPVTSLHSPKSGIDKNMYKALKAEKNPTIRFRMERYTVTSPAAAETLSLRVAGTLTIAGAEKNVTLIARAWKGEKGEWVDGIHSLDMSEYGIKPATMMMGAIKVADRVELHYHLLLAPGAGALGTQVKTEK